MGISPVKNARVFFAVVVGLLASGSKRADADPKALRTEQCSALHSKAQSAKIAPFVNTMAENATSAAQVLASALLEDSKADANAYQGNLSHAADLVHHLSLESSAAFENVFETDGKTVKTAAMADDCADVEGKGRARMRAITFPEVDFREFGQVA